MYAKQKLRPIRKNIGFFIGLVVVASIFIPTLIVAGNVLIAPVSAANPSITGQDMDVTDQEITVTGEASATYSASVVNGIGDVNNDGIDDYAISAPEEDKEVFYDPDGTIEGDQPVLRDSNIVSSSGGDFSSSQLQVYMSNDLGSSYANLAVSAFVITVAHHEDSEFGIGGIGSVTWDDGSGSGSATLICSDSVVNANTPGSAELQLQMYYVHTSTTSLGDGDNMTITASFPGGPGDEAILQVDLLEFVDPVSPVSDSGCNSESGGSFPAGVNLTTTSSDFIITSAMTPGLVDVGGQDESNSITSAELTTINQEIERDGITAYHNFSSGTHPGVDLTFDLEWYPEHGIDWITAAAAFTYGEDTSSDPSVSVGSGTDQLVIAAVNYDVNTGSNFINSVTGTNTNITDDYVNNEVGFRVDTSDSGSSTVNVEWDQDDDTKAWATGAVSLNAQCASTGNTYDITADYGGSGNGGTLGQYDYSYDSYDDNYYYEIYVDPGEPLDNVTLAFDLETDGYPSEGDIILESPLGTQVQMLDGNTANPSTTEFYEQSTADFDGEDSDGTWIVRAVDSNGDGGHGLDNVVLSFGTTPLSCPGTAPAIDYTDYYTDTSTFGAYAQAYTSGLDNPGIVATVFWKDSTSGMYTPYAEDQNNYNTEDMTEICSTTLTDGRNMSMWVYNASTNDDYYVYVDFHSGSVDEVALHVDTITDLNTSNPVAAANCTNSEAVETGSLSPAIEIVDNFASPQTLSSASSTSFNVNVEDLENDVLAVAIGYSGSNPNVTSITYNGANLTNVCQGDNGNFTSGIWYIVDPDAGNNSLSVSFSTTVEATITAVQLYGVNPSTPISDSDCAIGGVGWDAPGQGGTANPQNAQVTLGDVGLNNYVLSVATTYCSGGSDFTVGAGSDLQLRVDDNVDGCNTTAVGTMLTDTTSELVSWDLQLYWPIGMAAAAFTPILPDSSELTAPTIVSDNSGALHTDDNTASTSFNFNVSSQTDSVLVAAVNWSDPDTITSATYNGDAMTIACQDNSVGILYLANPDVGNNSLQVNFSGSSDGGIQVLAVHASGVDQDLPIAGSLCKNDGGAFTGANSNRTISGDLFSGPNNLIISNATGYIGSFPTWTQGAGATAFFTNAYTDLVVGAASYEVATSYTQEVEWTLNYDWPLSFSSLSLRPTSTVAINQPPELTGGTDAGTVYVLFGDNTVSPLDSISSSLPTAADASYVGEEAGDELGAADFSTTGHQTVTGIGDVNGDGIDDFAFSSTANDSNRGKIYVVFGHSGEWALNRSVKSADASLVGESVSDRAGYFIEAIGDYNNDSYDDFAVSAPFRNEASLTDNGEVYIVLGRATGSWSQDMSLASEAPSYYGNRSFDQLGMSIAGTGHIAGNSLADFAIGAPLADLKALADDTGMAFVITGDSTPDSANQNILTGAATYFEGEENDDFLGTSVASVPSYNGDTRPELIVSAPGHSTNVSNEGSVYVLYGMSSGVWTSGMDIDMSSDYNYVGTCNNCQLGVMSDGLDYDGDGDGDLLLKQAANDGGSEPEIFVVFGQDIPWSINTSVTEQLYGSYTTAGVEWASGLGDINNDGYDDIGFGIPSYNFNQGRAHISLGDEYVVSTPGTFIGTQEQTQDLQLIEKPDGDFLVHYASYESGSGVYKHHFVSCQDSDCDDKVITTDLTGLTTSSPSVQNEYVIAGGYASYDENLFTSLAASRSFTWFNPTTGNPLIIGKPELDLDNLMIVQGTDADFSGASVLTNAALTGAGSDEIRNLEGVIRASDDRPFLMWFHGEKLWGMKCTNDTCTSGTPYQLDTADLGYAFANNSVFNSYNYGVSIALDGADRPRIAAYEEGTNSLILLICNDDSCSSVTKRTLVSGPGSLASVGYYGFPGQIVIRGDGTPAINYRVDADGVLDDYVLYTDYGFELRMYSCDDATCTSGTDNELYTVDENPELQVSGISAGHTAWVNADGNVEFYSGYARGQDGEDDADYNIYQCYNDGCTEGRFRRLKDEDEGIIATTDLHHNTVTGRYSFAYLRHSGGGEFETHLFTEIPVTTSSISNLPGTLQARQISRVDDKDVNTFAWSNPQTQNFSTAVVPIRVSTSGGVPISDTLVSFNEAGNCDWNAVSGEVSGNAAVIDIAGNPCVGSTHTLYVPKVALQDTLHICPNATSLAQVTLVCAGGYDVTASSTDVSIVTIDGNQYWKVENLTGTGGLGTGNTTSTYIDLTAEPATLPSNIDAAPEVAVSTNDQFYLSYIPELTEFGIGDIVDIVVPQDFDNLAVCAATGDADGDSTADYSTSIQSDQIIRYTFTDATTQALTSGVEFCFDVDTAPTAANYSIAVSDTNDGNFSAALIYVGDDNDVNVSAVVPVSLSLRIKESTSTNDTNSCDLGVLNPGSVNSCTYRVAVGTNSASGAAVYVLADGTLDDSPGDNIGNDINNTLANTDVEAGTEAHGVVVSPGTGFTVGGSFSNSLDNPVPAAETLILNAAAAVNDSLPANWSGITHSASINASTAADSYDQIVIYRAWLNS